MQIFTWILRYDVILKFCYFRPVGVGGTVAAPEFGRPVNPIHTREQIMSTTLLVPPHRILRPSYGPLHVDFILKILLRYK